jgi:HSP20 family protein
MARNPMSPFRLGGLGGTGLGADPFMSLHREMNRLFDDAFRGTTGQMPSAQGQGREGSMLMPHMDVSETERELKVCVELPGVSESDVEVILTPGQRTRILHPIRESPPESVTTERALD